MAALQYSVVVVVEAEISEEDEVHFSGWGDEEVSKGTMTSEVDEAVVADGSVGKITTSLSATETLPLPSGPNGRCWKKSTSTDWQS